MNLPLLIVFGIGMLTVGFLLMREIFKRPQTKPQRYAQQPEWQPQVQPIQYAQQQPQTKRDFKEIYNQVQREMITQKKQEGLTTPQSINHGALPRESFKTVDTDFQQAQTKVYSMTPLKQPINPEEMDLKKDAFRYWSNKQPMIYGLLAVVSLVLFFLMGV